VTYRGRSRQWLFPDDLPGVETAHRDVIVGIAPTIHQPHLGDVPTFFQFSSCCIRVAHPDYVLPANFLPVDGATVDFAGIDSITYTALPTDGASALFADQTVAIATLPAQATEGPGGLVPILADLHPTPTLVTAVEYYNAARDHYFITASAQDIDALDSGDLPGWQRTGESFPVAAGAVTQLNLEYTYYGSPACRFYIPPAQGDSHFFAASGDECAAVQSRFPTLVLESPAAFHVAQPDPATGQCPAMPGFIDGDIPLRPVFRLWDGRADANHRYTTRPELRSAMIDRGWVPEGYGPLGVVWCVY
jgi:hypothetical protein